MHSPGARLWFERLLRLLSSAGAAFAGAVAGVIRNKWLATHLEAPGLGILAQIVSTQSWLGIAAGLGLGLPVAHAVSRALGRGDADAARRSVWTALSLTSVAAGAAALVGLLFAPAISSAILGSAEHANLVRISMIGVACFALTNTAHAVFSGHSDVRGPLAFAAVGGAAAVVTTFLFVPRWGVMGGVLAAAIHYPAGLLGALLLRRKRYIPAYRSPSRPLFDRKEARALLKIAAAGLLLALTDLGVLLALRAHYLRVNGIASNGLLQAAIALSQQVGSVFYAYYSSYAFGKVTAAATTGGPSAVEAYTRRQWTPLLLLAAAVIGVSMVAATPLLHLLYSSRFDAARPMMAFALLGEFCRVATQAWALGSLPLGGRGLWFAIGVAQPLSLAGAYVLYASLGAGTMSLPWAYASAGIVTLGGAIARMSRAGVAPGRRELIALLVGFAVLGMTLIGVVR